MHARLSIGSLLHKTKGKFLIPAFQRRYVWGQNLADKNDPVEHILKSLLKSICAEKPYFLNTMQLRSNGMRYEVVDGQQRLTFIYLLMRYLGCDVPFTIEYECRKDAEEWISNININDIAEDHNEKSQDIFYFKKTLRQIKSFFTANHIDSSTLASYILDNVYFLVKDINLVNEPIATYGLMNGTKTAMAAADLIKADILRIATKDSQPHLSEWEIINLRARYATEWENWVNWWNRPDVREYYAVSTSSPLDLLITLSIRRNGDDITTPLTYKEFHTTFHKTTTQLFHAAKHFFIKLRRIQKKFEEAYTDTESYNRIRAILLLQEEQARFDFLHDYFIGGNISKDELVVYYKLSFLGMTIEEIRRGDSAVAKFDELVASLSMADVYLTESKRDVFNLLLRLNIDEDIKLGRRFDFSIWNNRSLEHIYSKSKVWHIASDGNVYDGNDNRLNISPHRIADDKHYLPRTAITNHDGVQLSEHCLGNLVLLYGNNNAAFGNASFEQKKMMFLTPGDLGIFRSRNLLHSVCVFAVDRWDHKSIIDNYNLTLKNLKLYYGFKTGS